MNTDFCLSTSLVDVNGVWGFSECGRSKPSKPTVHCQIIYIKNLQIKCNIADVVFLPFQHTVKATENTITFCVTFWYYILCQKLLHFALTKWLHFASKVITFWVTFTFCVQRASLQHHYDFLDCELYEQFHTELIWPNPVTERATARRSRIALHGRKDRSRHFTLLKESSQRMPHFIAMMLKNITVSVDASSYYHRLCLLAKILCFQVAHLWRKRLCTNWQRTPGNCLWVNKFQQNVYGNTVRVQTDAADTSSRVINFGCRRPSL